MNAGDLRAVAAEIREKANAASPGPWGYNSYAAVYSAPKVLPYDEWEYDERHSLERAGNCELCGEWREPLRTPSGEVTWTWPRGHGCKLFETDYDMDPVVAWVPAHHGDTAVRQPSANAEHIPRWNPTVALAVADWLAFVAAGKDAVASVGGTSSQMFADVEVLAEAFVKAWRGES